MVSKCEERVFRTPIEKARSADARSQPKKFPPLTHPREHLIYVQASFQKLSKKNPDSNGGFDLVDGRFWTMLENARFRGKITHKIKTLTVKSLIK